MFGFDKPPLTRFVDMVGGYLRFDFGRSFFRDQTVVQLILQKMPVSISLGLWSTLLVYFVSIPLGIAKAVRDGSRFDLASSAVVLIGYAIPSFLFAILLVVLFAGGSFFQWFPLRGLTSEGAAAWSMPARIADYAWHMVLPTIAVVAGGFASLTMLTKNCFLEEIRKQYTVTARAKGASERRVLYGHVFRNAMLLIVAGFPQAFIGILFTSALLVEIVFSLDGIGLLGFQSAIQRDYPVMFGTLYIFTLLGLLMQIVGDMLLHGGRSAHRLRGEEVTLSPITRRRLAIFRQHRRGYVSFWVFLVLFGTSLFAEFIANDRPLLIRFDGHWYVPVLRDYSEDTFGADFMPTEADYTDPDLQQPIKAHGWMIWPAVPYSYATIVKDLPTPGAVAALRRKPAGHRRPGARRAGARDLRLPAVRAVRLRADHRLLRRSASRPARCRATTAALTDLLFQRFIEIWNGMPQLYLLIILASIITPASGCC